MTGHRAPRVGRLQPRGHARPLLRPRDVVVEGGRGAGNGLRLRVVRRRALGVLNAHEPPKFLLAFGCCARGPRRWWRRATPRRARPKCRGRAQEFLVAHRGNYTAGGRQAGLGAGPGRAGGPRRGRPQTAPALAAGPRGARARSASTRASSRSEAPREGACVGDLVRAAHAGKKRPRRCHGGGVANWSARPTTPKQTRGASSRRRRAIEPCGSARRRSSHAAGGNFVGVDGLPPATRSRSTCGGTTHERRTTRWTGRS